MGCYTRDHWIISRLTAKVCPLNRNLSFSTQHCLVLKINRGAKVYIFFSTPQLVCLLSKLEAIGPAQAST